MQKEKINKKLNTPSDLSEKGREEIALSLNTLVADAFALYVKTKNFHWHLSGSHFRDYHLMFDEHADQIFATIDVLAERVRKIGKLTIHSIGEIGKLQTIEDSDEHFLSAESMLQHLLKDNRQSLKNMRKAHKTCDKYDDAATASILEVFMDETERRIWFLFETLA